MEMLRSPQNKLYIELNSKENLLIKSILAMNKGREEGLIPVIGRKERADKEFFSGFRIGSDVQETPITKAFNISSRAVCCISQKELVQKLDGSSPYSSKTPASILGREGA